MTALEIIDLTVSVGEKQILHGVTLTVPAGEVHVVMGPNGSGKSTLAHAIAGRPGYTVTGGRVLVDGEDIVTMPAYERARRGVFLALQQPLEVPGVRLADFLTAAGASPRGLHEKLTGEAQRVGLRADLLERFVNVDLSGGERKRAEVVQLSVLQPKFAVLDEIDSGLDVDALDQVARRLFAATSEWNCGVLAITHFERLLKVLTPSAIHVMSHGRVVATGGPELAAVLERDGYVDFGSSTIS